jgi:hypothetical protein
VAQLPLSMLLRTIFISRSLPALWHCDLLLTRLLHSLLAVRCQYCAGDINKRSLRREQAALRHAELLLLSGQLKDCCEVRFLGLYEAGM